VDDMVTFFELFLPLAPGFGARAARTRAALGEAALLLVAAPEPAHFHDAAHLRAELTARGLAPAATIFNRAFVPDRDGQPLRDHAGVRSPASRTASELGIPPEALAALDRLRADAVAFN